MWAVSKVQPRTMEASSAGPIISGSFRPVKGSFDGVTMHDLGKNEAFQALLDKDTGEGVYVQHFYDYDTHFHGNGAAIDEEGNYFLAARSSPTRLLDGDRLQLSLPVENVISSKLVVLKLDAKQGGATRSPSCLVCDNNIRTSIRQGYCFAGEVCYADGETGNNKLGEGALICDAEQSQTVLQDFRGAEDRDECKICGDNGVVTKPEGMFDASLFGVGTLECSYLEEAGLSGELMLDRLGLTCSAVETLVSETCGCKPIPTTAPTVMPTAMPTNLPTIGASPTTAPVDKSSEQDLLSTGAIIGITVSSVVVLILVVGLLVRKKLALDVHVRRKPDESVVAQGDADDFGAGADADVNQTDSSRPDSVQSDSSFL